MKSINDIVKYQSDKENVIVNIAKSKKEKHVSTLIYSELKTERFGLLKEYRILDYQYMGSGYSLRGSFSCGFDKDREQALSEFNDYVNNWNKFNIKLGKLKIVE